MVNNKSSDSKKMRSCVVGKILLWHSERWTFFTLPVGPGMLFGTICSNTDMGKVLFCYVISSLSYPWLGATEGYFIKSGDV